MVDDYWAPTEGNAKKAVLDLISLGALCINHGLAKKTYLVGGGIWQGD